MTREEALKILDTIPTISEQVDALDMAIKALEQEPCEDATLKDIFCMGCEYKKTGKYTLSAPINGNWDVLNAYQYEPQESEG